MPDSVKEGVKLLNNERVDEQSETGARTDALDGKLEIVTPSEASLRWQEHMLEAIAKLEERVAALENQQSPGQESPTQRREQSQEQCDPPIIEYLII